MLINEPYAVSFLMLHGNSITTSGAMILLLVHNTHVSCTVY